MRSRSQPLAPPPETELGFEEPGSEIDLGQYVDLLRRRWRLAAAIVLVCLAGGLVHYLVTPKMYKATTVVQIDRRSLSLGGAIETTWLENIWNMEFYPTQYRLLESRGLAERVVMNLRLYEDPVFNPGWAGWAGEEVVAASDGAGDVDAARLGRLGQRLQGGLRIAPVKSTQLVEISYHSPSPQLAARIANGVAEAFIEWGMETRSQTVDRASGFLGSQIETIKGEIVDREARLQAYSRRTDIVAIDPQSNPTMQRLGALNQDYIKAVSARIDAEVRYNESLAAPAESVADAASDGVVADLRRDLVALEQEYATKLNTYKPDMPQMVELQGRIEESRRHIAQVVSRGVTQARETARAELQTARRRESALTAELARVREETIQLGSAAVEYNNLQMEIATRRQLLDELLKRQSETEVAARLQAKGESNVRTVDSALVPGSPYRPSLRKDLGMAGALGLFLGIGCIFLLEYLDRTIKTVESAERSLGLPVLAVIPDVVDGGKGYGYGYVYGAKRRAKPRRPWRDRKPSGEELKEIELLPQQRPRHAVSEAYRSLRTALLLSTAEELRVVALTSAQSGEGKTATAANLAVVLAQLGRRVLLIDADLRKPRQHRVFQLSNRHGLVHALTSHEDFTSVVQPTTVPGLAVMTSGTVPPNPSELLASDRMRRLLELATETYDIVLVDTPPVLAVTDASLVGAMADGVVFCLQAGRVVRDEAMASCDRLRMAGVKLLGSVLNRYLAAGGGDGKRYYYQYQAYGEESGERESTGSSAA